MSADQPSSETASVSRSGRIQRILDGCLARLTAGESVPFEEVRMAHPDLMPELGEQLQALRGINEAARLAEQDATGSDLDGPTCPPTGVLPATMELVPHGHSPLWLALATDVERSAPPLFPGYEINREIHRGGQGVVYEAIQKSTRKTVAIKVMREGPFASDSDRARFEREVQILAAFKHPNIVTIHDSGITGDGHAYFVMDYIAGESLDAYIARAAAATGAESRSAARRFSRSRAAGDGPSIQDVLGLFAKICEAVNAAHLRGIIHRDLKPGNIRLDQNGEPHILDFGLAKIMAGDSADDFGPRGMTVSGYFIGSLPWASPEQAEGASSSLDIRADVYALGVILYQMLTGRFPYEVIGTMRDVLDNILNAQPARPSTIRRRINDEVETIVLKCLAKKRERRYQSAGELARDVQRYLVGDAIEAKRDSRWYVLRKMAARNRAAASLLIAFVTMAVSSVAIGGYFYSNSRQAQRERGEMSDVAEYKDGQIQDYAAKVHPFLTRSMFGWFLAEWRAGQFERARAVRDQYFRNVPEHAIASFMLDDEYPVERLMNEVPESARALAWFAVGERQLRAGRLPEAIQAFESVDPTRGGQGVQGAVQARLHMLRQTDAAAEEKRGP